MELNCIEIFVINIQELKHKEDIYSEEKMYSIIDNDLLYVKIGKYVMFIEFYSMNKSRVANFRCFLGNPSRENAVNSNIFDF